MGSLHIIHKLFFTGPLYPIRTTFCQGPGPNLLTYPSDLEVQALFTEVTWMSGALKGFHRRTVPLRPRSFEHFLPLIWAQDAFQNQKSVSYFTVWKKNKKHLKKTILTTYTEDELTYVTTKCKNLTGKQASYSESSCNCHEPECYRNPAHQGYYCNLHK